MKTTDPMPPPLPPRPRRKVTIPRDSILWCFGLAVLWHEVFNVDTAEPLAVAVGLGLVGSPFALRWDEARRAKRPDGEGD